MKNSFDSLQEAANSRIPRKKGQPAKSKKHSDLYTDEDPKGTIHGLGFKDKATARSSVAKIKKSSRSHAHKIQAAIAMEQRARVMGKTAEAAIYRKFINSMKKKTQKMNEGKSHGDHEHEMIRRQVSNVMNAAKRIKKKVGKGEGDVKAWVQSKITKATDYIDTAADYMDSKDIKEGSLHKWFSGSKSKDGKGGWVNVRTGGTCASDEPGEGVPKCVSRSKYESMTKKERESAARRKKAADPNQQKKRDAAKPTYVATDKPKKKKKLKEGWSDKYKQSIDCDNPKGFSQKAHCQSKKKMKEELSNSRPNLNEKCWKGYKKKGMKTMFGKRYPNCVKESDLNLIWEKAKNKSENNTIKRWWDDEVDTVSEEGKSLFSTPQLDKLKKLKDYKSNADKVFKRKETDKAHYEPEGETISEVKDKKGKGSGTKDACYHKVKSRYSVWPSAYASGALVKCRKVGAANWGNSRKEEVEYEVNEMAGGVGKKVVKQVGKLIKQGVRKAGQAGGSAKPKKIGDTFVVKGGRRVKVTTKTSPSADYNRKSFMQSQKDKYKAQTGKDYPTTQKKPPEGKYTGGGGEGSGVYDATPTGNINFPEPKTPVSGPGQGKPMVGKVKIYKVDPKTLKNNPTGKLKKEHYDWRDDFEFVKEGAAWTKKAGKNEKGGLNEKGRKSYERENPGSDLKRPSKKVGNKRRASFCARMKGMKKKLTSKKTANDPDSRINKSLRAWNC